MVWKAYVKAGKPKGWPNFRKLVRKAKEKQVSPSAQEQPAVSGRKRRAGGAEAAEGAGEAAAAAAGGEAPAPPAKRRRKSTKLIRYTAAQVDILETDKQLKWVAFKEAHKGATAEYAKAREKNVHTAKPKRAVDIAARWSAKLAPGVKPITGRALQE